MHAISGHDLYDDKTYDVFSRSKSYISLWTLFILLPLCLLMRLSHTVCVCSLCHACSADSATVFLDAVKSTSLGSLITLITRSLLKRALSLAEKRVRREGDGLPQVLFASQMLFSVVVLCEELDMQTGNHNSQQRRDGR